MAAWQPFVQVREAGPSDASLAEIAAKNNITVEELKERTKDRGTTYRNNIYLVIKREFTKEGTPTLVHLSIKRLDNKTIRDWRDMQRIKNELVGEECEGVELFPAESRLVDTSNQFHIWVMADPTYRFPFGYGDRLVSEGTSVTTQRPFRK